MSLKQAKHRTTTNTLPSLSRLPRTLHVRAKTTPSSTPGAHTFIKDEGVDAGKGVYTGTGQASTTFFFLTSTVRID
jgi:hypothetical protein